MFIAKVKVVTDRGDQFYYACTDNKKDPYWAQYLHNASKYETIPDAVDAVSLCQKKPSLEVIEYEEV